MTSLVDFVETLPLRVQQEGFLLSESQLATTAAVLESCSQQLKSLINSRTAMNRLPPEIFKIIFEHVSADYHASDDRIPCADIGPLLLSMHRHLLPGLTQVCQRWRDIALHTSSLWGHFDPSMPPKLRNLLRERAAGASLTVNIQTTLAPWLKDILDADGARVKMLIADDLGWAHVPDVVDFPAPLLRFARIEQAEDRVPDVDGSYPLFKGDAPRLSRLHLLNISARLTGGPGTFNALTELYICNSSWAYLLASLASILRATPNLIKLLLYDPHRTYHDTDAPNAPPSIVRLGRLEQLEFTAMRNIHVRKILKTLVLTGGRTSISLSKGLDASLLNDVQRAKGTHADALTTIYILHGTTLAPRHLTHCIVAGPSSRVLCEDMALSSPEHNSHWWDMTRALGSDPEDNAMLGLPETVDTSSIRDAWFIDIPPQQSSSLLSPYPFSMLLPQDLVYLIGRMSVLETITMSDKTFYTFCEALGHCRDLSRWCSRLSSIHILFNGSSESPEIALDLLVETMQGVGLDVSRVKIGYLPGYRGERVAATQFDAFFHSVEYVSHAEMPRMETPHMGSDPHSPWPAWPPSNWQYQLDEWSSS